MRFPILALFTFMFFLIGPAGHLPGLAQVKKYWPSAIDYKLKGKVKSWTMFREGKVVRQQKFNRENRLVDDTYEAAISSYDPFEYYPEKRRLVLEQVQREKPVVKDSGMRITLNKRMQFTEIFTPGYQQVNTFDPEGKILISQTTRITAHTRAWNSLHHAEPVYTYIDTVQSLIIFKYNKAGKLTLFEYYENDLFKNLRLVYSYDSANNLLESRRYDYININRRYSSDHYLKPILGLVTDTAFDMNRIYPNYWAQGMPYRETWRYNSNSNKIEYLANGPNDRLSYKVTWEYDRQGKLNREVHYDTYHNTIRHLILFDNRGNVISETDFDYWEKKQYQYRYIIEYY